MLTNEVEHFGKSVRVVFVWYYTFIGQVSQLQSLEVFLAQQRTDFSRSRNVRNASYQPKLSFHPISIDTTQPLLYFSPEKK